MEDLNMKKKIYSGIFMISLALSGAIYAACEDIDELPPQSDTNFINKTYKLPFHGNDRQGKHLSEGLCSRS